MKSHIIRSLLAIYACISVASTQASNASSSLPIVDLGYNIQRAASYNETGDYYSFNNIRYAAPPTGTNRFAAPQPPQTDRSAVKTGEEDRICAQGSLSWATTAIQYVPRYLSGQTDFSPSSFNNATAESPIDPRTTEDCLFLDIAVPGEVLQDANKGFGAPVMVWVHGGGYAIGSKSEPQFNPAGLLARSMEHGASGVVYVALNYRLGAFGFLSGPTFQSDGSTTANVGLHDQRFALEWIQNNIRRFGGDPDKVTVIGESAGGGSIMHHLSAFGGSKKAPFQQAILQSPGYYPVPTRNQQEVIYQEFLNHLNVSSVEQARELSFDDLHAANNAQTLSAPHGGFGFGPAVDGNLVTALPLELFSHGQFDKSVRVMVGHNSNEGILFTSPFNQNDSTFRNQVITVLPSLQAYPSEVDYIADTLYPPIFNGSQDYSDQIGRAAAFLGDIVVKCNAFAFDRAYDKKTYAYAFSAFPALHADDINYTFYNDEASLVQNATLAKIMQRYFTSFSMTGDPNGRGTPLFDTYGVDEMVQDLNVSSVTRRGHELARSRCDYWSKVLYA